MSETGSKRKRIVLSLQQKLDIIQRLDQGETVANLAAEYNVGKTSVADIKTRKDKIINYVSTFKNAECMKKRKTMKSAYNKKLDDVTFEWYSKMEKACIPMTSQAICNKAMELNKLINGSPDFKASCSWLRNFKSRHGLDFINTSNSFAPLNCDSLSNETIFKEPDINSNESLPSKISENTLGLITNQQKDNIDNLSNHILNQNASNRISEIDSNDIQPLHHSTLSAKRKRVVLSLKQKIDIINRIKDGESEISLAKEYNIAYSSLKAIKTNQSNILDYVSTFESPENVNIRKTMKSAFNTDLDNAVFAWYKQMQELGQTVNGPQICDKALELNKEFGGSSEFKASCGWLKNFKSRHGLPVHYRDHSSDLKNNQNFNPNLHIEDDSLEFSDHHFEDFPRAVLSLSDNDVHVSLRSLNQPDGVLPSSQNHYDNGDILQSECFPSCDVILTVPEDSNNSEGVILEQFHTHDISPTQPATSTLLQSFDTIINWLCDQKECTSLDMLNFLKFRELALKKEMSLAFSSDDSEPISRKIDTLFSEKRDETISIDCMYEMGRCNNWITSNGYTKVALQFPDSMLNDAASVCLTLGNMTGQQMFVLGDTSYGSCCVDEVAAEHISADAIIHFGHSCLSPTKRLPVLHVFGKHIIDAQDTADACRKLFPDTKSQIILIYEVMYAYAIGDILKKLEDYENLIPSKLLIPGESSNTPDINANCNEITKCYRHILLPESQCIENYCVFYIGSRAVTLTNFMLSMKDNRFFSYNPLTRGLQVESLDMNKHLKRRYYYIEKAKDAKIIGILVGTLGVTDYMKIIKHLKELIKSAGKKSYTLVIGKLNVAKLANFAEIDVFVNVACPEASLVESRDFYQSIVTPYELEIALNKARSWTGDYLTDFREILPGAASYIPPSVRTEIEGDVSLISGKLRQAGLQAEMSASAEQEGAIVSRSDMKLSTIHIQGAGEFLSQRTWQGVEQHLGETPVALIEQGQRGIACKYDDETSN